MDKDELDRLSEVATQGEWFAGSITTNDDDQRFISVGPYDLSDRPNKPHHYEDTIFEVWDNPNNDGEPEATANFITALINLWRTDRIAFVPEGFPLGSRARKTKGSSWQGRVVGFYSTSLTPDGIAVESENEPGSVQIYPAAALEPLPYQKEPSQ